MRAIETYLLHVELAANLLDNDSQQESCLPNLFDRSKLDGPSQFYLSTKA